MEVRGVGDAGAASGQPPSTQSGDRETRSRTASNPRINRLMNKNIPSSEGGQRPNSTSSSRSRHRRTILGFSQGAQNEFSQEDREVVREALLREEALLRAEEEDARKDADKALALALDRGNSFDLAAQLGDLPLDDFVLLLDAQAAQVELPLSTLASSEFEARWSALDEQLAAMSKGDQDQVAAAEKAFNETVTLRARDYRIKEDLLVAQVALEQELVTLLAAPLTPANVQALTLLSKTARIVSPTQKSMGWASARRASGAGASKAVAIKIAASISVGNSRARFQRKKLARPRPCSVDVGAVARKREATQTQNWEPPLARDDVIKMPLTLAAKYGCPLEGTTLVWDDDGETLVSGSTRELLLRLVTSGDRDFVRTFLLASAYFVPDETLLQMLVLFYRAPPSIEADHKRVRDAIVSLIELWIPLHFEYLKRSPSWVELLQRFCLHLKRAKEGPDALEHASLLSKRWEKSRFNQLLDSTPQKARTSGPTPVLFTDVDPVEMARQMTLKEHFFFSAIPLREYYQTAWTKNAAQNAPHMHTMIERFNEMSFWVASSILLDLGEDEQDLTPKERGTIISYWIRVLKSLEDINNFNSAFQLFTALNMTPIQRLKKTWEVVPKSDMAVLDAFSQLLLSNYKGYREHLDSIVADDGAASTPFVPIHSLVLRDLSMVEEMQLHNDDGSVYWEKVSLLGNAFNTIQSLRQCRYPYAEDAAIQALFASVKGVSEDELYSRAEAINRAHASPAKLQRKTSFFAKGSPSKEKRQGGSSRQLVIINDDKEADPASPLTVAPPSPSTPARRDSLSTLKNSLRRSRANSDGKSDDGSASPMSPRAEAVALSDRKRSKSIRDLFKSNKKSSKESLVVPQTPERFAELQPASEAWVAFRDYLERKMAAELLDVLQLVQRIEESDWNGEELAVACEGLCRRYLGLGDEPEEVAVEEHVLDQIRQGRAKPSRTMFGSLKQSVRFQLESHYVRYYAEYQQQAELRKSTSSNRDKPGTPRSSPSLPLTTSTGLPHSYSFDTSGPSSARMATSTPAPLSPGKEAKVGKTPRK